MRRMILLLILLVFFAPAIALATDVGGIINTNTTWNLAGSPYLLISEVQIAEGVTLTIEPGVVVNTPGYYGGPGIGGKISIWGSLSAVGTGEANITFNGVHLQLRASNTTELIMQYTKYNGGKIDNVGVTGDEPRILVIRDSRLEDVDRMDFGNVVEGSFIERNIFNRCKTILIWTNETAGSQKLYIRNNYFLDPLDDVDWIKGGISIGGYSQLASELVIVAYNSFISTNKTALSVNLQPQDAQFTALNNYWNTTDTSVIDSMIYDRNDDLAIGGYVTYIPFLTEPHPDTPTLYGTDFSADVNTGEVPLTVNFTDLTKDGVTSWLWDFGDGSTSTEKNPRHTYTKPGSYSVSLTVTGPLGPEKETKVDFIMALERSKKAMPGIPLLLLDD